jgi:uncharacterized protein YkwD
MTRLIYVLAIALVVWIVYSISHDQKVQPQTPQVKTATAILKPSEPHHDTPTNKISAQFYALTNADRTANHLPALTYDTRLEHSAALKCQDLLTYHYFGHDRGQGIFVFFPKGTAASGENLEQGDYPPSIIEQAWLASPKHRANILGHYDSVGFAQCADKVVEHFVLWPAISKGAL